MADLGYEFDAEQVEPSRDRDPVPPGEYVAQILSSEMKPASTGNGQYLNLEWVLTDDGPHQNRRIYSRLNLANTNAEAVRIAQQELSSICRALGKLRVQDSSELHDIPCILKIRIQPAKGDYPPSNQVSAYKPIAGRTHSYQDSQAAPQARPPAAPPAARPPAASAPPAAGGAKQMPWMKNKAAG